MTVIPTIKVKSDRPGGYLIINATDFDPAVHKPWVAPVAAKPSAEAPSKAGAKAAAKAPPPSPPAPSKAAPSEAAADLETRGVPLTGHEDATDLDKVQKDAQKAGLNNSEDGLMAMDRESLKELAQRSGLKFDGRLARDGLIALLRAHGITNAADG